MDSVVFYTVFNFSRLHELEKRRDKQQENFEMNDVFTDKPRRYKDFTLADVPVMELQCWSKLQIDVL